MNYYNNRADLNVSYDAEDRSNNDNSFSLAQAKQEAYSARVQLDSLLREKSHMQEELMRAETNAMDSDREIQLLKENL